MLTHGLELASRELRLVQLYQDMAAGQLPP